jgi:predicted enzyme related to lactoylglutathione lyase
MFTARGVPVAGIFRLTDEMRALGIPPNWMPYVESNNVADTVALATSLGAQILHGPVAIPNVGDIAVIRDPQGAAFGVYKSTAGGESWDGTAVIGHFSWNELMTTDHATAFDFYRRLFGWDNAGDMDMGEGLMYRTFGKGSAMYGGMFTTPSAMAGMHPFWLCYIHVKDVPQALATATKAGASVQRPPMEIPGGVIAVLGDPQGAGFALHHENAAAPAVAGTASKAKSQSGATTPKAKPKAASKGKSTIATRSAGAKPAARKSGAKKSGAKKSGARKSAARKSAAKKSVAKKSVAKKSAAKRPGAKKSAAKKAGAKKPVAKKSAARSSRGKKSAKPVHRAGARKRAKAPARKQPRKAARRKAAKKK